MTGELDLDNGNASGTWETSGEITIASPEGFHARPAAVLVKAAKKFSSEIQLVRNDSAVNAKSLVSVMGLALRQGDSISIRATGADAKEAISALAPVIEYGPDAAPPPPPRQEKEIIHRDETEKNPLTYKGISASPGIAVGFVRQAVKHEAEISEIADAPEEEREKFNLALSRSISQLRDIEEKMASRLGAGKAAIFAAHIELLEDPELLNETRNLISQGKSASYAWTKSYKSQAAKLAKLQSKLFAARAADLEDVGERVLLSLAGSDESHVEYGKDSIIVAEDLNPSDADSLDRENVLGFCTVGGSATSHIAILARSLSLPAIVGIDRAALEIPEGAMVMLDGNKGLLRSDPNAEEVQKIRRDQEILAAKKASDLASAMNPAITKDGHKIEVAANIGGAADAREGMSLGGDGVGLLRSEFLFIGRSRAPSFEEQASVYVDIARAVGEGKPLVIRTLDVGGDKPVSYIKQDKEENPFLGVRGIRLSLKNRELFESQLSAILQASEFCDLHVMFPMVSTIGEFREARDALCGRQRIAGSGEVKIGVMVETPSAALLAGCFAKEADFMSIGTNDLTQYTLAADRGNPNLAGIADGLEPSVLKLISSTVEGAQGSDCWVGVCGGLAGDLLAIPLLIGMGVTELSVSAPSIPSVKASVRGLRMEDCRRLARETLDMESAGQVRAHVGKFLGIY
jgi:phosphocarrier protein FPr